ncbi:MAG: metal-dependent hydrolase [Methanomicrobiales archaeon]|nr:metal-dependent hydrolase [Methanomicrobiales archaeon]
MDIFTHAVAILVILYTTGNAAFIPFGIIGAVIIDIDMAYAFIPRRVPSLYLLHHGGFTHSVSGATFLSAVALGAALALSGAGLLPGTLPEGMLLPAFACVLAGAYLHLFLDYLAAPGLPLLYPVTEKRYGLAMFPMPVYLLISLLSIASLAVILLRGPTQELAALYGVVFSGLILISAVMTWQVHRKTRGRSYPTLHPFQWIVIRDEDSTCSTLTYDMFRGVTRERKYEKYRNITPSDVNRYDSLPELRRHRYFSYLSTVEKNGTEITFHDPVREEGLISYPPWYPSVTIRTGDAVS